MPQSRNRHKHHHHHPVHSHSTAVKVKRTAAFVVSILVALLGLAVAYFTQGPDGWWMLVGAASGAVIGYFVGHSMDKSMR